MRKVAVVTGCAGLLGTHFSRYLLDKGWKVVGIDDLSGGYSSFLPDNKSFRFFQFDTTEKVYVDYVFKKYRPSVCYHFGAYAAEGLSPFIRSYNYTNNILASVPIINNCITHDVKLVFTSSMAVYGNQETPFHESMTPQPIDPYGIAKYAVEMDIAAAGVQHGLRYNIVRPHNVLGIYQNIWDKYRNVIGIFIRRAINNQPLLVYGDGEQTRAFSDIQYYMKPFHMLRRDTYNGEIFNLGADQEYRLIDVANMVKSVANMYFIDAKIKHVEPRHEVKNAYCDHSKAKFLLNFEDKTDLKDLICRMFTWAMSEPERSVKKFKYEVKKGIYEYWK